VSFDRRHVVGRGKVLVYSGHFDSRRVTVSEVVMSQSDWHSPEGRKIIRVSCKPFVKELSITYTMMFRLYIVK
jgi:hypothetical protein